MYLNLKDIQFSYDNAQNVVLSNFSVSIDQGEIVSVVGNSGSGKSTLLRIISGLEDRSTGQIELDGDVLQSSKVFVQPEKRKIGFVFQDYALYPFLNVRQNIEFGIKKLPPKERKRRIEETLSLVKINELEKRFPHELSGGQMQRVALARALAPKPRVLLMDEPFSNLDTDLVGELRLELRSLLKKEGMTVILVTHNQDDAGFMADRIIKI
ncbi:MAG: ABC transporter ATP-binding protein [Clostridiales bacterium]|nr:ABC transporter ATP-binding protein [Clostridiales bacterium]